MVSAMISRVVILVGGTLYPAYRSYKAVRTKDVREYVKWMMYWIVFALFLCAEAMADMFVSFWCPFYYELKMIFVLWLLTPYTKGASVLYRKFIHPTLNRHERDIDQFLDQAKNESYKTVMRLGSRGLLSAREILANAAVGSQSYLVQQLRRSQSLNDISDNQNGAVVRRQRVRVEEIREEDEDFTDGDGHHEEERRWEGFYDDDGQLVEEQFQYLEEEQDVEPEPEPEERPVRRSTRRRKPPSDIPDGYATLPRSSQRNNRRKKVNSEI